MQNPEPQQPNYVKVNIEKINQHKKKRRTLKDKKSKSEITNTQIILSHPEQNQKKHESEVKEELLKDFELKSKQQKRQLKEQQQQGLSQNSIFATKMGVKPTVSSPQPTQARKDEKTQKNLASLLKWVTKGHLIEVEKLLNKNPQLVFKKGTVTDLSDRTFREITVFQYAAWACDIEMCELILNFLDNQSALDQLTDLEKNPNKYSDYGAHFDISLYTTKSKEYIKNYSSWDDDEREPYWQKEVGGGQRQFPAWLVYAMCEKGENVAWVKKDMKNMKITRQYEEEHLKWWFDKEYNGGKLGSTWGAYRGRLRSCAGGTGDCISSYFVGSVYGHDNQVGQSVKSAGNEALLSLKASLVNNKTLGK